jgi:hypothetical protein
LKLTQEVGLGDTTPRANPPAVEDTRELQLSFFLPFNDFNHNFFDTQLQRIFARAILPCYNSLFWSVEDDLATISSFPFRPDLAHLHRFRSKIWRQYMSYTLDSV